MDRMPSPACLDEHQGKLEMASAWRFILTWINSYGLKKVRDLFKWVIVNKNNLDFQRKVYDDFAIIIPAGKWHNLINTGNKPIKLYSIYAPPQHPHGTVHETKEKAEAAEINKSIYDLI
jgi:hypothetical protein